MFEFEKTFPIQYHSGIVHVLRYKKGEGLSVEKCDITNSNKYENVKDALNVFIDHAINISQEKLQLKLNADVSYPYTIIQKASNSIAYNTRRSSGNFAIGKKELLEKVTRIPTNMDKVSRISDVEYKSKITWISTVCELTGIDVLSNLPFDCVGKDQRITYLAKDIGNKILIGYTGETVYDTGVVLGMVDGKFTVTSNIVGSEAYYCVIEVEE